MGQKSFDLKDPVVSDNLFIVPPSEFRSNDQDFGMQTSGRILQEHQEVEEGGVKAVCRIANLL